MMSFRIILIALIWIGAVHVHAEGSFLEGARDAACDVLCGDGSGGAGEMSDERLGWRPPGGTDSVCKTYNGRCKKELCPAFVEERGNAICPDGHRCCITDQGDDRVF